MGTVILVLLVLATASNASPRVQNVPYPLPNPIYRWYPLPYPFHRYVNSDIPPGTRFPEISKIPYGVSKDTPHFIHIVVGPNGETYILRRLETRYSSYPGEQYQRSDIDNDSDISNVDYASQHRNDYPEDYSLLRQINSEVDTVAYLGNTPLNTAINEQEVSDATSNSDSNKIEENTGVVTENLEINTRNTHDEADASDNSESSSDSNENDGNINTVTEKGESSTRNTDNEADVSSKSESFSDSVNEGYIGTVTEKVQNSSRNSKTPDEADSSGYSDSKANERNIDIIIEKAESSNSNTYDEADVRSNSESFSDTNNNSDSDNSNIKSHHHHHHRHSGRPGRRHGRYHRCEPCGVKNTVCRNKHHHRHHRIRHRT